MERMMANNKKDHEFRKSFKNYDLIIDRERLIVVTIVIIVLFVFTLLMLYLGDVI